MSDDSRVETAEWRPVGEYGGAPLGGAGDLSAILPSGRVIWLRVEPSPAPAHAVERIEQEARFRAIRRRARTRRQALAIRVLGRATVAVAEALGQERLARARALRRRIVRAHRRSDERITTIAETARAALRKQLGIQTETARRIDRRDLWDKLVVATSLPLFAAFGQKDRPFGSHNVALTLSTLIWLVGDDVVDAIFGPEEKSPYPLRDLDVWSYIAPAGNLLSGWWLLSDFQHERFVSGRLSVPVDPVAATAVGSSDLAYSYVALLDLSRLIAPSHRAAFETFRNVPTVATVASVVLAADGLAAGARITDVTAQVKGVDLVIGITAVGEDRSTAANPLPAFFRSIDVAFLVDTQEPTAAST
jgi:hypothetical protein